MSQAEINEAMIRHASQGRIVVRLKGGDPAIFARLAEELAALEAAGVPYEIVPGVTAASAASSHAGVPLTDRDEASCVAFVTGQECGEQAAGRIARLRRAGEVPRHARVLHGHHDGARLEPRAHRARQIGRHAGGNRAALLVARSSKRLFTTLGELPDTAANQKAAAAGRGDRGRRRPRADGRELVYTRGRCSDGRCS